MRVFDSLWDTLRVFQSLSESFRFSLSESRRVLPEVSIVHSMLVMSIFSSSWRLKGFSVLFWINYRLLKSYFNFSSLWLKNFACYRSMSYPRFRSRLIPQLYELWHDLGGGNIDWFVKIGKVDLKSKMHFIWLLCSFSAVPADFKLTTTTRILIYWRSSKNLLTKLLAFFTN